MRRRCQATTEDASPCRQAPRHGRPFCFWHDPETADDARRAREVGGKRAHREAAIAGAFNLGDLSTPEGILRLFEISMVEAMQIEDPVQKVRAINQTARYAALLLEITDSHERLRFIKESKLATRRKRR